MLFVSFKYKLLSFVEKITYMCATKIYPNSKGLLDFIVKYNFTNKDKLKLIENGSSNGIDTDYFNPNLFPLKRRQYFKQKLKVSNNKKVFIFIDYCSH